MNTILVTGASGFIGTHVRKCLCEKGYRVIALSRTADRVAEYENESWVQGDLSNVDCLSERLLSFQINACIHLAWEGIPDYSFAASQRNLQYGIKILELCSRLHISHLAVSGSCWEYKTPSGRIDETWQLDDSNHFKAAKNSLRMISHAFCKEQGIHLNWLRLFYVYGPGQRSGSLIPYIEKELAEGRVPQLNGAYNENDFVHVEDVAQAFVEIIEKKPKEEIFNIGSGRPIRVLDILKSAARHRGIEIPGGMYELQGTVTSFYADISKIRNATDWMPLSKKRWQEF